MKRTHSSALPQRSYIVNSRLCIKTKVPPPCKQPLAFFDPVLGKIGSSLGSES